LNIGLPKNRIINNSKTNCYNQTSKFTEHQIIKVFKKHEQGRSGREISLKLVINKSTFYYWRKKYEGMDCQELKRLKELETENRKLKQMYAVLSLETKY